MKNIDKLKAMTADQFAGFLLKSGYVQLDQENPYCSTICPDRDADGKCNCPMEDVPCLSKDDRVFFIEWLEHDDGDEVKEVEVMVGDGLRLAENELAEIESAISYVWEVGYKDKMMLLVEAISALTSIETVLNFAAARQNGETKVYEK